MIIGKVSEKEIDDALQMWRLRFTLHGETRNMFLCSAIEYATWLIEIEAQFPAVAVDGGKCWLEKISVSRENLRTPVLSVA